MIRRSLAGSLILLLAIMVGAWTFVPDKAPYKGRTMTTVVPPDTHIEWKSFPVEGLILCNPVPDTTGNRIPCIKLPEGALLLVPEVVEGKDPAEKRTKS